MALKTDFRKGDPLHAIPASWLSEVGAILNTIDVAVDPAIDIPTIDKPPHPTGSNPWLIRIPAAGKGGEGTDVPPAAWCVRKNTVTETTSSGETTEERWQIFAPTWTVGRDTLLPAGMGRDWNDLPDVITSGTLYAALTWEGTATVDDEGQTTVSWTPGTPVLTNSLADIPPDDDPSGAGTSSATPGHRSVIVEVGAFSGEGDALTFAQRHLGVIVEAIQKDTSGGGGDTGAALALGPLTELSDETGTRYVRYLGTWSISQGAPRFTRATSQEGSALPPAETLTPTFVQLLFRKTTSSGSSGQETATGIGYVRVPLFFPGQLTDWMTRKNPTLQDKLTYAPPSSETGTGFVTAASTTLSYFSDEDPASGPSEELFAVQVEEANKAAHYSTDAGGN